MPPLIADVAAAVLSASTLAIRVSDVNKVIAVSGQCLFDIVHNPQIFI